MTDSAPKPQGTRAAAAAATAVLRYAAAALGHCVYWLVFLNLSWPFGDLDPIYPPENPGAAYFVPLGITAAIGAVGLAGIGLLAARLTGRKQAGKQA